MTVARAAFDVCGFTGAQGYEIKHLTLMQYIIVTRSHERYRKSLLSLFDIIGIVVVFLKVHSTNMLFELTFESSLYL